MCWFSSLAEGVRTPDFIEYKAASAAPKRGIDRLAILRIDMGESRKCLFKTAHYPPRLGQIQLRCQEPTIKLAWLNRGQAPFFDAFITGISNNVGSVNRFLSPLFRSPTRAFSVALVLWPGVEDHGSSVIFSVGFGPTHASLRSRLRP